MAFLASLSILAQFFFLSICAADDAPSANKAVHANPTMESVGPVKNWIAFRNKKNHFEFKKPASLDVDTSDPENGPEESNVVHVLIGRKTGLDTPLLVEFSCIITRLPDLDRYLAVKAKGVRRELNLNGSRAVLWSHEPWTPNPDRYVRWEVASHCNSKSMYMRWAQKFGEKEFAEWKRGVGNPDPVIMAMIESFKCLKK